MKTTRILLALAISSLFLFTGCKKKCQCSYEQVLLKDDHWQSATFSWTERDMPESGDCHDLDDIKHRLSDIAYYNFECY